MTGHDQDLGIRESFERYQTPEYHVPQALILDFDRMLGDVEACMTRFYDAAELFGVGVEEVKEARTLTENDGGSFSPLKFIKEKLSAEAYQQFCEQFVQADGPPVLYEDAARFLQMLQYSDVPHIVLTYGVDPEWQQLKLAASGYQVGAIIMDHTDKGVVMETLRSPDGTYRFFISENGDASYVAESLCLIDDKPVAFKSLPSDCTGVLVQRGDLIPSQQGERPQDVSVVQSLDELVINENGQLVRRTDHDMHPPYNMERRHTNPNGEPLGATAVYSSRTSIA